MEDGAPPLQVSGNRSSLIVIVCGLATTALALLGVWFANQASDEFNIMSWYGYYILPIGSILVGLVAGSGYGISSWLTGVRISRTLLLSVVILQVAAYFAAQYIEYRYLVKTYGGGEDYGFFEHFDLVTRSFAFREDDGDVGSALGAWGYLWRVLEIAGFAFGGLVAPLVLRAKPYCDNCQRYMRTRNLGLLPAGVPVKKIKKKDTQAQAQFAKEHEEAWSKGMLTLEELRNVAQEGKTSRFNEILATYNNDQKSIDKLTNRISVSLSHCPNCNRGLLKAVSLQGRGDKIVREDLGTTGVNPGLSREID